MQSSYSATRGQELEVGLDIVALGLLSSVGHDVETACAAIRAGISRPGSLGGYTVADISEQDVTPVIGHPLTPLTQGFAGSACWLQMAAGALENLISRDAAPGEDWARTALVVLVPGQMGERFIHDTRADLASVEARMRTRLLALCPSSPASFMLRSGGRGALSKFTIEASSWFRHGQLARVVIVCVDSYTEPFSLEWLIDAGRLKHGSNPVGLMPGEAAVALALRPRATGQEQCLGRIVGACVGQTASMVGEHSVRGREIAALLGPLLTPQLTSVIVDLNGEPWRAETFSYCLGALTPTGFEAEIHTLASEVGDVGSSFLGLGCALASHGLRRDQFTGRVLVIATGESGEVGAIALERSI